MRIKRFNDWPIATKLRWLILAACMATVGLTCALLIATERTTYRRQIGFNQVIRARILSFNATAALAFSSQKDASDVLGALKADPHVASAALFDANDELFVRYRRRPDSPLVPSRRVDREVFEFENGFIDVWVPIELGGRPIGILAMRRDLDDLEQQIRLFVLMSLAVMAVAGAVGYLIASRLQRLISEPVLELAGAAAEVTQKRDYSIRVRRTSADEIGGMIDSFNSMLATIEIHRTENGRLYEQIRQHADALERRVKERTAQLENANEELEAFGSSVSHDLRGPIRHVEGYARALLEDYGSQLPPDGRDFAVRIIDRMEGMNSLINSLLEVARAGKRAIDPRRIDLAALCREVFDELKSEHPGHDVRLEIEPVPPCLADPVLCRQVMVNLVANALKYSRNQPISIVRFGHKAAPGEVGPAYFVQDNGIGFDLSRATRLFTPFVRLENAGRFEGSGIGLSTVKRIIQRHGGRIWAESSPDAGATFYFTLPTA